MASLGTADDTASGCGNAVQIESHLTGSAEKGGEAWVQVDAAGPALWDTTALSQASTSLIPQRTKQLSAASAVKKGLNTRI